MADLETKKLDKKSEKGLPPAKSQNEPDKMPVSCETHATQPESRDQPQTQASGNGNGIFNILIKEGLIPPDEPTASFKHGVPLVSLKEREIQREALALIPERLARKYKVLPLEVKNGCLTLVMTDPEDSLAYRDAQSVSGMRVIPVTADPAEIEESIRLCYKTGGPVSEDIEKLASDEIDQDSRSTVEVADAPIDRVIKLIIQEAIHSRASDIHIEPQSDSLRIRYRIDGVLHEIQRLPLNIHNKLLSRLKLQAKMDIAERRRPQDGHFNFDIDEQTVDVRIGTFCTVFGEMAVLRLLNRNFTLLQLDELGLDSWSLARYKHLLQAPYGMILVAGPTGSGKTTTLYASINHLKREGANIITIEDPVEYEIDGVNHCQTNIKANLNFANGIRAMLRLDPDVIVVGEIRDRETAQTAVEASLTGCLVLSSIHASDAARAFTRMLHLGVEPYLLSSSVIGVVAQRIVRRVCHHCAVRKEPTPNEKTAYAKWMNAQLEFYQSGTGCKFCANTGYHKRIGLFEVLLVSDSIRQIVVDDNASPRKVREAAFNEGMIPLEEDGMSKVREGITTPSEVLRSVFAADSFEPQNGNNHRS